MSLKIETAQKAKELGKEGTAPVSADSKQRNKQQQQPQVVAHETTTLDTVTEMTKLVDRHQYTKGNQQGNNAY